MLVISLTVLVVAAFVAGCGVGAREERHKFRYDRVYRDNIIFNHDYRRGEQ